MTWEEVATSEAQQLAMLDQGSSFLHYCGLLFHISEITCQCFYTIGYHPSSQALFSPLSRIGCCVITFIIIIIVIIFTIFTIFLIFIISTISIYVLPFPGLVAVSKPLVITIGHHLSSQFSPLSRIGCCVITNP